jgi:GntP family gluconate:H+ symporter
MQTSFMHPPFGFALFYLRSVAPTKAYTDRVTGKLVEPVTTMQIYWGAVPFLLIQLAMVGLIIAFPGIVSSGLDEKEVYDLDKVMREMEANMPGAAPEVPAPEVPAPDAGAPATPAPEAGASAPEGGAAAPAAEDDPMKAMLESMERDKK